LVDRYQSDHACDFPWDILFKDPEVIEAYWMDKDLTVEERLLITVNRRRHWFGDAGIKDVEHIIPNATFNGGKLLIDALVWFSDLPTLPETLRPYFKDGQCGLGEWFAATMNDKDLRVLPKDLRKLVEDKVGFFGYTHVNWRNLYMDPLFATFIARLFQNSFDSGVIKQDFKLTSDHEKENLVRLLIRYIGRDQLGKIIGDSGLNIFNATSICSSLLLKLS
jgi:hypothetical protein